MTLTRALDALFHAAGDFRTAAGSMRPITPAEFQQQRAFLALAARIRSDVARIGNAREEGNPCGTTKIELPSWQLYSVEAA